MTNYFKILAMIMTIAFVGCQQSDDEDVVNGTGEVSFSFDVASSTAGRVNSAVPDRVVVTIQSTSGDVVYNQEELNLIEFNGNFISEPISLQIGNYQLTEYFVLDATGATIYATPLLGSDLAYLVNTPLPIDFSIANDASDQITPEVLSTEQVVAADFGYVDFDFNIVNTFEFLMSVHYFNESSSSFDLTDAHVVILGDGNVVYDKPIAAETDQIRIRDDYANFEIITSKIGYMNDTVAVDVATLKGHFNDPLEVILQPIVGYFYANNDLNNATPAIWTANKIATGMDVVPGEPHKIQFQVSGTFTITCGTWVARTVQTDPAIMSLYLNGQFVGDKVKADPTNPLWIEMHGDDKGEWTIQASAGDIIELTVNGIWDGVGGNDYLEISQVGS